MKSLGSMEPRVGCRQRARASTPIGPAGGELDDRLVVHLERLVEDVPGELGAERVALDDRVVDRGVEHRVALLAVGLGRVHRDVRVAQQIVGRGGRPGAAAATPMLAPTDDLGAADEERRLQRVDDPPAQAHGAAPMSVPGAGRIANSSPPSRAARSSPRISCRMRSATATRSWSPTG